MRLAVLIPAFNAGDGLERTLGSLAVDPVPFDIVIVDDGSDPPVVAPDALGAHRVVVVRLDRNQGVARALNAGLSWILARDFDAVARLDAGDENEPGRFKRQLAYLTAHPEVAVIGAWTRHVDADRRLLYTSRYPDDWTAIRRQFHYRSPFSHPTCVIRADALREAGGYDPGYPLGEDYELFWRLAEKYPCANLPEVLVTRLESPASLTRARRLAAARTRLMLQWHRFDWAGLHSWLGVLRSIGLLCIPGPMTVRLKRLAGTVG